MKDAPGTRDYDWLLLAILAAICALGVIEIYSATHGSTLSGMHIAGALVGNRFRADVRALAVGLSPDSGSGPRPVSARHHGADCSSPCWAYSLRCQTLDQRPGYRRTSSGVRIGQIDYNHSVGALLCGSPLRSA